jgi:undecaprenyl-diphosphatase
MPVFTASTWLEQFDRSVLHWVNCDLAAPWLQDVLFFLQSKAVGLPLVLVAVGVIGVLRGRRIALHTLLACLLGYLGGWMVAESMWATIARPRPPRVLGTVLRTPQEIGTCASKPDSVAVRGHISGRPGFPSQHATHSATFALALFLGLRWIGMVAACYAVLVAMARMMLGTHWPTDVAAGLFLGVFLGWGAWWCVPRLLALLGRRAWVDAPPDERIPERSTGAAGGRG